MRAIDYIKLALAVLLVVAFITTVINKHRPAPTHEEPPKPAKQVETAVKPATKPQVQRKPTRGNVPRPQTYKVCYPDTGYCYRERCTGSVCERI